MESSMTDNTLEVYVDTREKTPYQFRHYDVETTVKTLETGDYCLKGDGVDMTEKTFSPHYTIERKGASDFLSSISHNRERFENELRRANELAYRMPIIISSPWGYFSNNRYMRDVHPNAVDSTVDAHVNTFNVEYFFQRDKRKAEQLAYEFLEWRSETM